MHKRWKQVDWKQCQVATRKEFDSLLFKSFSNIGLFAIPFSQPPFQNKHCFSLFAEIYQVRILVHYFHLSFFMIILTCICCLCCHPIIKLMVLLANFPKQKVFFSLVEVQVFFPCIVKYLSSPLPLKFSLITRTRSLQLFGKDYYGTMR